MRVALGKFARSAIEAQLGGDVVGTVQAALSHYTGKLRSGRPPIELPRFCRETAPGKAEVAFDLAVDPETEALLEREAAKQKTSVSLLAAHSVLIYLAELDFLAAPSRPV